MEASTAVSPKDLFSQDIDIIELMFVYILSSCQDTQIPFFFLSFHKVNQADTQNQFLKIKKNCEIKSKGQM